jgi:CRP-like cAMP-binding protein
MSSYVKSRRQAENLLLSSIPTSKRQSLIPHLELVSLAPDAELYATDGDLACVYFPIDCVISFLYTTAEGDTVEAGLTGNEGMVGLAVLLGGGSTPSRAVVQSAGQAWKVRANVIRDEFARGGYFQRLLLRYTQVLLTQVSQTAVCNRFHSVEKRLCRRLLLCHDRLDSDDLMLTQEFIAKMLGGRRESVTVAARRLKNGGLIRYSRGHIEILSRPGLESAACECYRVVRREEDRLLGKWRPQNHRTPLATIRGALRAVKAKSSSDPP